MAASLPFQLAGLGYVGVRAPDPEGWRAFATDVCGLEPALIPPAPRPTGLAIPNPEARGVAEDGVGFAFARTLHPAMRFAGPVRAELGIPTVFNILGPLSHPGHLTRQVVGVPDVDTGRRMAEVLAATGSRRAMVVTGDGGLDELSVTGENTIHEIDGDEVPTPTLRPRALGLTASDAAALHGGDAAANAAIAHRIFAGEAGPQRDIVVLNAAAGLVTAASRRT